MSHPDHFLTEPHVSPDELRAALAPRRSRPSPVVPERRPRGEPAWEWTTEISDGDDDELRELRGTVAAQRERIDVLEVAAAAAREAAREAREALSKLAAAPPLRRRALRREMTARGLL
jgi:hypothetical protein